MRAVSYARSTYRKAHGFQESIDKTIEDYVARRITALQFIGMHKRKPVGDHGFSCVKRLAEG